MKAYCQLSNAKGDPQGRQKFYQIFLDLNRGPSDMAYAWQGPYRDKTDAENAAYEEAARKGYDLEWVS